MFQKGQSGNPGGRPSMPPELKEKVRAEGDRIIQFWIDTYRDETKNWLYRDKAAANLMAYGFGKPRESIDIDVAGKIEGITIEIVKPRVDDCY